MYWFYSIALLAVALFVLYLLWYYPNPQTTLFVKSVVGLAWFACLSVLVLVPEDIKKSLADSHGDHKLYGVSGGLLENFWSACYWTTISFIMALPFLQKYSDSGGFSVKDRLIFAVVRNGTLICVGLGVLASGFLILYVVEKELTLKKFISWLAAFLNAYGQISALILTGYGMVDIPRKLWLRANFPERQNFLFQTAGMQLEKSAAAHLELSKQVNSVRRFNGQINRSDPMRQYMDVVYGMLDRIGTFEPQDTGDTTDEDILLDIQSRHGLATLRQRLRKAIEGYYRERERYLVVVHEYLYLHETLHNVDRRGGPFVYLDNRNVPLVIAKAVWWWRCKIKPLFHRILALVFAGLSITIIVAEVTIADYIPNLSVFSLVLKSIDTGAVLILTAFLMLVYVMSCMYYTVVQLGRFSFYMLVPKHTAPFSLASNALLMCRFSFPLVFNFFAAIVLPIKDGDEETVEITEYWEKIGRRISESPILGKYFTTYIPILMLPYVLLIAFGGINRLMAVLDRKFKFSFKENWHLDNATNYASNGRQVMNLELEYYQKGWEPGLTITESVRLAEVSSGVGTDALARNSSLWGKGAQQRSDQAAKPSDTPTGFVPTAFDVPQSSLFIRRTASFEEGSTSTPIIPRRDQYATTPQRNEKSGFGWKVDK